MVHDDCGHGQWCWSTPAPGKLADLRNALKAPAPLHNKTGPLGLPGHPGGGRGGLSCRGRAPSSRRPRTRYPGARRASAFQRGVMLKLLVRVPLRQRNVREMQLDQHLTKDHDGALAAEVQRRRTQNWHAARQVNEYHVDLTDYCPEFLPVLEEFLRVYRPRLPNAATSPFLFLTRAAHRIPRGPCTWSSRKPSPCAPASGFIRTSSGPSGPPST